ncbi:MAG: hypothetical protein AAF725_27530, partial [Acidobacteriota bacterium]
RPEEPDADLLFELFGEDFGLDLEELRACGGRDALLERVRRSGIAAGRLSPQSTREELARYLDVHRAHLQAGRRYAETGLAPPHASGAPLSVTQIRAAEESQWGEVPEDLGWGRGLAAPPAVAWHPGSHLGLFDAGKAESLGALLRSLSRPVLAASS